METKLDEPSWVRNTLEPNASTHLDNSTDQVSNSMQREYVWCYFGLHIYGRMPDLLQHTAMVEQVYYHNSYV